jgi:hypothetical protein
MRAAGVREFRIPDEWIAAPIEGSVLRYRDEMADMTVFRLVEPGNEEEAMFIDRIGDVIDGEVVGSYALPAGGGA